MQVKEKYERDMRMTKQIAQQLMHESSSAYSDKLFESLEYIFDIYINAKRWSSYYENARRRELREKREALKHE